MTQNTFLVKVREVKQLHWKSGQMSGLVLGLSFQSRLNKKNKLKLYMSCKLTRLDVIIIIIILLAVHFYF